VTTKTVEPARSVVHATFSIERIYEASCAQVFKALTDPAAKAKWFSGGNGYSLLAREMDVRPGGREMVKGRWDSLSRCRAERAARLCIRDVLG